MLTRRSLLLRWLMLRRLMLRRLLHVRRRHSWVLPCWCWRRLIIGTRRAQEDALLVVHLPERSMLAPVREADKQFLTDWEQPAVVPLPQLLRGERAELIATAIQVVPLHLMLLRVVHSAVVR